MVRVVVTACAAGKEPSSVPPMVMNWPVATPCGGADMLTQLTPAGPVIVDPGTMSVPSRLSVVSVAVKFAVGLQTLGGAGLTVALLTDRTLEFSTRNTSPGAIPGGT